MRRILFALALIVPAAALGQPGPRDRVLPLEPPKGDTAPDQPDKAPDAAPDQQVPDLQLIPGQPQGRGGQQPQRQGANRPPPKPPETDEQLLEKLAKAADRRAARPIERELQARWAHSGSPSADLLLKRADQAMEAHDFDTAREIAQKLTEIAPDFSEAWHRRATLASQKDDYQDALDSLRRALALRPKHFMALAELGEILEEFNDKMHALDAYRQAKTLDPFIEGLDDRIRALTKSVEGQGI
jgi:tetratricopeptide (TPR) repeat protein